MKITILTVIASLAFLSFNQVGHAQVSTAPVSKVVLDLPDNPLPNVQIGMTLGEFIQSHPKARSGMFGKPINSNKPTQTVFEAIHSYGGEETVVYYFSNNILATVDYSIFPDNESEYKIVLKKILQHYRVKRGKEHQRRALAENLKEPCLAGYLQWDDNAMGVGVEFAPSDSTANRKALVLVRLTAASSKANLTTFEKKRKTIDAKKMTELFKDAD